jgi:hypothetical protein
VLINNQAVLELLEIYFIKETKHLRLGKISSAQGGSKQQLFIYEGKLGKRCCYKTVDFATVASQNGVCITQGKCHKII